MTSVPRAEYPMTIAVPFAPQSKLSVTETAGRESESDQRRKS
ncbi:hypothetical protein [Paenibacillus sp.]|nr:hypothetical protein [Paenibacillus sp.]